MSDAAAARGADFDIGRAIDDGRWTGYQKLVLLLVGCAVIFDGFDNQSLGFAAPAIIRDWGISKEMLSPVMAIGQFGMMFGAALGGMFGDRFGRKYIIWFSILGALPFTLLLPHVGLIWTGPLTIVIGLILASAFPAIVVFAQELVPGKVGMISGLFFGFSFGMGGLGAAVLGWLADRAGIDAVYQLCAFLPAIGLLTALLPDTERKG